MQDKDPANDDVHADLPEPVLVSLATDDVHASVTDPTQERRLATELATEPDASVPADDSLERDSSSATTKPFPLCIETIRWAADAAASADRFEAWAPWPDSLRMERGLQSQQLGIERRPSLRAAATAFRVGHLLKCPSKRTLSFTLHQVFEQESASAVAEVQPAANRAPSAAANRASPAAAYSAASSEPTSQPPQTPSPEGSFQPLWPSSFGHTIMDDMPAPGGHVPRGRKVWRDGSGSRSGSSEHSPVPPPADGNTPRVSISIELNRVSTERPNRWQLPGPRQLISGNRRRFVDGNYDLDLTYITDRCCFPRPPTPAHARPRPPTPAL